MIQPSTLPPPQGRIPVGFPPRVSYWFLSTLHNHKDNTVDDAGFSTEAG